MSVIVCTQLWSSQHYRVCGLLVYSRGAENDQKNFVRGNGRQGTPGVMNARRLIQRPLREVSPEFPPEGLFMQTASPCGTFSQFQSGPKPQLAEFGNRAAKRRIITATAAHKTSAMRSRRLIDENRQIISSLIPQR